MALHRSNGFAALRLLALLLLLAAPAGLLLPVAGAAAATPTPAAHGGGMPCEDAAPLPARHASDCAMGCAGSPAPDHDPGPLAPASRRAADPETCPAALPAPWAGFAPRAMAPHRLAAPLSPPRLPVATPVTRKTRLLN